MGVSLYEGISKNELNSARTTSEGKSYTINHPDELLVNMRYKGNTGSNVNSQGWERSSSYYFKELQNRHPECFSKKNNLLIESGRSPIVDKRFAEVFPQYKNFKGETLVHHHIGQDGQAVAIPQSIHKGSGEIHTVENYLGVTNKAQVFSKSCEGACKRNPSLIGQTSDKFKSLHVERTKSNGCSKGGVGKSPVASNSIKNATHKSQKTSDGNHRMNLHGKNAIRTRS